MRLYKLWWSFHETCMGWDTGFVAKLSARKKRNCRLAEVEVEVTLQLTVRQSACLDVGHPFWAHDQILLFSFLRRKIALLFILGRPLWREDGSVICSAICQWSESRRTHNHTFLSHLRLLGSLPVASYGSQRLRWKYSYPPPHGVPFGSLVTEFNAVLCFHGNDMQINRLSLRQELPCVGATRSRVNRAYRVELLQGTWRQTRTSWVSSC
jgi:hypothetical protein